MTSPGPEHAIAFEGVSYRYPGGALALSDITMRIEGGSFLGVIGPNGGGKSTLLRLALGLLAPTSGRVRVFGRDPAEARREGLIASVEQESGLDTSFPLSVRQVVTMGGAWRTPWWRGVGSEVAERVERAIGMVGLSALAERPIGTLSGGQRQRAMIARALAAGPRVLALDEPVAAIDESGRRRFLSMLASLHAELGLTILMVTHDLRSIAAVDAGEAGPRCDRIACLRGTLHFHDAPSGITPGLLAEVFEHDLSDVFGRVHVDAHPREDCDHVHGPAKEGGA